MQRFTFTPVPVVLPQHQEDGRWLGTVVEVYGGTGEYDVLRIQLALRASDVTRSKLRTVLMPFAAPLCPEVDLRGRRLVVAPPEGLLDLVSNVSLRKVCGLTVRVAAGIAWSHLIATPLRAVWTLSLC